MSAQVRSSRTFSLTAVGREPHHAVVSASPQTPLGEVAARLGDALAEPGEDLYLDGRRLDPLAPLSEAGLREGAVVGYGRAAVGGGGGAAAPTPSALVELHAVSGPGAGRIHRLGLGRFLVGSGPRCAVRIDGAPELAAELSIRADGTIAVTLREGARLLRVEPPEPKQHKPKPGEPELEGPPAVHGNGTGAGAGAAAGTPWPADADLLVGPSQLRWAEPAAPDSSVQQGEDGVSLNFNRPPRIIEPVPSRKHRIPPRPTYTGRSPFPMVLIIMPTLMGAAMVIMFHNTFYIMFAVFSPVFALANWIHNKRSGKKDFRRKLAEYVEEKAAEEQAIAQEVAAERVIRLGVAIDPAEVLLTATGPGRRLWERRRRDPDHLVLRIGMMDQPSMIEVEDPDRSGYYRENSRWNVPAIPVAVGLADRGVLALAGPPDRVRLLAGWLLAQAAVLHSPRDLRLLILTEPDCAGDWEWARWLPHLRSPYSLDAQILVGNDEETTAHRISELLGVISGRREAAGSSMRRVLSSDPDIIVVVDGARRLRDTAGLVQILTDGPAVRVFAVCIDREVRLLPEEATSIVLFDGDTLTLRQTGLPEVSGIRPDLVHPGWLETVARALTPLRDATPDEGNVLPDTTTLLDLLGLPEPDAEQIVERWQARPASTLARIGVGYGGPLSVDLAADGPHALIAGTTGSGKSELLQTLVASLAVANRPDELTFLLIDYKGGSAFRDCVNLPHTLGMVTDLDGHLVSRVLESLAAELRRRERLLAGYGAKDLPGYHATRRADPRLPPLPRLVLVVDEFATLVREVPEFIPGMVSIAQRGRSLGIHLVLATQRPAGVISADIKANTSLRIALRVLDPAESKDVIDTGDSAVIPANLPGRALIRLSHKAVAAFQAAYTGAQHYPDPEDAVIPPAWAAEVPWSRLGRAVDPPAELLLTAFEDKGPTDLAVLVEALRQAAKDLKIEEQPRPWLPPLPQRVTLAELPAATAAPGPGLPPVVIGLEDLPPLQAQQAVVLDLESFSHLSIIGTNRSGRSQALRTIAGALANRHAAAEVHFYGIDAAGGALSILSALPHTGAIASRNDLERIDRLISRLGQELDRRQELQAAHNATSLTELRAVLPPGPRPAHIVLFVDGWESLLSTIVEHDSGRLIDAFYRLLREGGAAGIHAIIGGDRALLGGRISSLNDNRLVLRMSDKTDFLMIGMTMNALPGIMPPGRAFQSGSLTEVQLALLDPNPSGQAQVEALRRIGKRAAARDAGMLPASRPFSIGELQIGIDFADAYRQLREPRPLLGLLGLGPDDTGPVTVDFAGQGHSFMVVGPAGSGRSTTLLNLGLSLLASGTRIVALTPRDSPLRRLAANPNVRVLMPPSVTNPALGAALAELGAPCVVLVDDIDLILQSQAVDQMLREVVATGRDRGLGLAVAGPAESFLQSLGGWVADMRRVRQAVLLSPQSMGEGDLMGLRIAQDMVRKPQRLGRGYVANRRTGTLESVAIPLAQI